MMFKEELRHWLFWILKQLPGSVGIVLRNAVLPYRNGRNVRVWDGVQIDYPSRLVLGSDVSVNRGCILNAGGGIEIGSRVLIGPNVTIYSQNHRFGPGVEVFESGYVYKKVVIGDGVWIAAGAFILPGVTVGSRAIIAAGSVVTKNVPADVVVAGNPARIVKNV
ncbi:acyltransferase [Lysobacter sp. S4-A87]|uniref:acyltransferase n=1 Tax=Lysobacter sp. S4-A87 TaxID=2925843 RepID=UPI001F539DBE|nr:acyltransferase [Lysobacter sp. S4-A87]UNK49665.1 acyltransferase [Lysobacter sp. S4-A87]